MQVQLKVFTQTDNMRLIWQVRTKLLKNAKINSKNRYKVLIRSVVTQEKSALLIIIIAQHLGDKGKGKIRKINNLM